MTFLGYPTIAELRDLVKAKDYTVAQMQEAWMRVSAPWVKSDSSAAEDFRTDLRALNLRYENARRVAMIAIQDAAEHRANPGFGEKTFPDTMVTAKSEWNGLLKALSRNWNGDVVAGVSKGDLSDLNSRLTAAALTVSQRPPDYSQMPQPAAGSDADLNLFKKADVALRGIGVLPPSPGNFPWARVIGGALIFGVGSAYVLPAMVAKAAFGGGLLGWLSTSPWKAWLKP